MKNFLCLSFFILSTYLGALAQNASNEKTLSFSTDVGLNLYSYGLNGVQINGLIQAQFPLVDKFAITTTTGINISPAKSYYRQALKYDYGTATGISLPVWIGGRYYLVKGLHANLELGADVKINRLTATQFHFSPGMGYVVPAGKSGFLNFSTHYVTGFKIGTSTFDFRIGYMFPI